MRCSWCGNTGEQRYLIPGPVTVGPFGGSPPLLGENLIGTHPCPNCRPAQYLAWVSEQRRVRFLLQETNRIP